MLLLSLACVGPASELEAQPAESVVEAPRNRLGDETSPYLLQHANNPVHWYAWGDEAFAEARRRDVPIFLSIGYAACHWCHVMEEESFEDEATAAYLNEHFVAIKVDREERPDVDAVYMDAIHALHGSGGWPASIWLTHERKPFYAGTYFPKESRYGRPSFREVLELLTERWETDRPSVDAVANQVDAQLTSRSWITPTSEYDFEAVDRGVADLARSWDPVNAGWGQKKFPMVANLELMLAYGLEHGDAGVLSKVRATLDAMDRGGIHDHLGGGFHRYTVDPTWTVPHFEKMTYDNGQLLRIYVQAAVALDEPRFAEVAQGIVAYMVRDMRHHDGTFYSSQDADSDGEEGTFYVWTPRQVRAQLDPEAAENFLGAYGVTEQGNFEGRTTVLTRRLAPAGVPGLVASREVLREARESRVPPPTDTKRVVAYNALMIGGLARGGRLLERPEWIAHAELAAGAVLAARRADGTLPRTLEPSAPLGVIDDYALLAEALLDLYMASHDRRWLTAADSVAGTMVERFWDSAGGGFFFSDADARGLLVRQKDFTDGARPSGGARAASVLARLRAFGAPHGDGAAVQQSLDACGVYFQRSPASVPTLLTLLDGMRRPSMEVIVSQTAGSAEGSNSLVKAFNSKVRPHAVLGVREAGTDEIWADFTAFVGKQPSSEGPLAYVCFDGVCKQPVATAEALLAAMAEQPESY